MNIGFIGTGNMGRILIEAFVESEAIEPPAIFITNRTLEKAYHIQSEFPGIQVCENSEDIVRNCSFIFLCVKPLDLHPLVTRLSTHLTEKHCLISITSPVSASLLEQISPCQSARVIPSITNRALSGVSLVTFGNTCSEESRTRILHLFGSISEPVLIEENVTRAASDIVSCGPAFFSYLLQRFTDAAVRETQISKEMAEQLASGMITGMGKLIETGHYTLPGLQKKVCVKGGVTGEGINVLEKELGSMFEHLFRKTHEKFDEDLSLVGDQFRSRR
ncbi:late competence protein ComER [Bacillus sp. FJAT-42376]|uniref:late competence protein ComER n=1 Tax=Bacillus sp. FJAT-42376 TaxID=2014076 RepID=UPI000F4E6317|nr:late competence protein ComER [Bacillus sp. FJAT-42376]AZB43694.1 late competence protein ComER [Bacillus sp. FJAT-42376]